MRCRLKRLFLGILVTAISYLVYTYVAKYHQSSGISTEDTDYLYVSDISPTTAKAIRKDDSPENLNTNSLWEDPGMTTPERPHATVGVLPSESGQSKPAVYIDEPDTTTKKSEVDTNDAAREYWERKGFADDGHAKWRPPPIDKKLTRDQHPLDHAEGDTLKDLLQRRVTVRNQCKQLETNHTSIFKYGHIVSNREFNLTYCFVPKAGCTFWKMLMYVLNKPDIKTASEFKKQLLGIRKDIIHDVPIPEYTQIVDQDPSFASRSRNFLFTRDPYERLFSAYVDQLVVPKMWSDVGKRITKMFRNTDSVDYANDTCGSDVSFQEFIWYVVFIGHTGEILSKAIDDHWTPVTNLCQPCQIKYKYIGKMETFGRDRNFILEDLKLGKFLVNAVISSDSARFAMNQTIESFWYYLKQDWQCLLPLKKTHILRSLWKSFKYQGYIPLGLPLPDETLKPISKTTFQEAVFQAYEENWVSTSEIQQRRRDTMVKEYQKLPIYLLHHIQQIFRADFELFSYDVEPADIFHRSQSDP